MIIGVTSDAGGGRFAYGAAELLDCHPVSTFGERERTLTAYAPVGSSVVKVGMPQVHIPATQNPL